MVFQAQYVVVTSSLSSSSSESRNFLSGRTRFSNPASQLPVLSPPSSLNLTSVPPSNHLRAVRSLAITKTYSEPKRSPDDSLFLHILDEHFSPPALKKEPSNIGSQEATVVARSCKEAEELVDEILTVEKSEGQQRYGNEECFSWTSRSEGHISNSRDGETVRRNKGEEFPPAREQQHSTSLTINAGQRSTLSFRMSNDSHEWPHKGVSKQEVHHTAEPAEFDAKYCGYEFIDERFKRKAAPKKEVHTPEPERLEVKFEDCEFGGQRFNEQGSDIKQEVHLARDLEGFEFRDHGFKGYAADWKEEVDHAREPAEFKVREPTSRSTLLHASSDKDPAGIFVFEKQDVAANGAGQLDHLEMFDSRRQNLLVGRQVFLTGGQDYKRWMPVTEEERALALLENELQKCNRSPESMSGVSPQAIDGASCEREGPLFRLRRKEAELPPLEATGLSGETSKDLLVEFLKRRSKKRGIGVKLKKRRSTLELDNAWRRRGPSADQSEESQQGMEISSDRHRDSATKVFVGERLLSASDGAVLTQEHLPRRPWSSIDDRNCHDAGGSIWEIVDIAKRLPQNASLEECLGSFHGKISSNDGNLVLKSLGQERLSWPLLSFFQWMRFHDPCLLDSRSFCTTFAYLGKVGMVDQALVLYRNMPEDGQFHCVQVYNSLLGGLARSQRPEEIAAILREMRQRHIMRDTVTYSILITSTKGGGYGGEDERLDHVWSIFHEMLREGLSPSVPLYGSLIKAFCDEGHLKEALLTFVSMEKMRMFPNVIIYNTLIDAHSKALKLEEAEGLLLELKERGLQPTVSTYNALINGYGRNGQSEAAEELFVEMQQEGLNPDVSTYTALISAYGKQKMTEKAVNVFLKMRKAGLIPTTRTYTTLINAYAEGGWHQKAQRAFDIMRREGLRPTIETYTALLDGYRRSGDLQMVKHVWNLIKEDGCEVTKITYRTLMDAFAKHGLYVDARDVMDEFRRRGLEPDTMIYNMLLNAYARGGLHTKLHKVLWEMQDAGCEPDSFTYCTLIYACLRLRDFTRAFRYGKEMVLRGLLPDQKTYKKMRCILDSKYALKLENEKKSDANQPHPESIRQPDRKNPQRLKRNFKRYRKEGLRENTKHERKPASWRKHI